MSNPKDTIALPNPSGLCMCGCGQVTRKSQVTCASRHLVEGEYCRYVQGHSQRHKHRIEYEVDPITGCWNWQRVINWAGYGQSKSKGVVMAAHRYVYIRERGPIPEGLDLDHLCRNRRCVNPDHMEPVTVAINNQRSTLAKITPDQVNEIRALKGKFFQREIGEMFGLSQAHVGRILRGKAWR